MLRNIDLLLELLDCFIVPIVFVFAEGVLLVPAASDSSQELRRDVLVEAIVVIASLNHSVVECLVRLFAAIFIGVIVVVIIIGRRFGRRRVDAADQRCLELKVLVRPNQYTEQSPDDRRESANESKVDVERGERPGALHVAARLVDGTRVEVFL